jgi:FkbM family methyltransferase
MIIVKKGIRLIRALLKLINIQSWGPFVEAAEITGFDHAFSISWSQAGEDIALLNVFKSKKFGTYIDIGAHHPSRFSVTRHLYQLDWNGVNVDANQELIEEFERHRSRDHNLCAAVGLETSYTFTIFEETAISTLNSDWRKKFLEESNRISKTIEIEGRKLRSILDDFQPREAIDLLSIDAEGSDLQVLQSLELDTLDKSRFPKWLLLEADPPVSNALKTPAVKLAMEWGYEPHIVLAMSTLLKYQG